MNPQTSPKNRNEFAHTQMRNDKKIFLFCPNGISAFIMIFNFSRMWKIGRETTECTGRPALEANTQPTLKCALNKHRIELSEKFDGEKNESSRAIV